MSPEQPQTVAYVFPGQGAQYVGMGKEIYEASAAARQVFHEAEEVLDFGLLSLCFEGPEDVLTDTVNAQPAILTVSIACLAAFREKCAGLGIEPAPSYVAGHSLGEYSALVAAGALEFAAAVALVRERGRLMKEAGDRFPGGMAAIMGLDNEALRQICEQASEAGAVVVANYNCPGQTVISGDNLGLAKAMELASQAGAKRALRLAVSIASHSPLMRDAAAQFTANIDATPFRPATVPVICNLTARSATSANDIKHELAEQLCNSVLWDQSVSFACEAGVRTFLELGPGQVLSGLIKRINRDVRAQSISDAKTLESAVQAFVGA